MADFAGFKKVLEFIVAWSHREHVSDRELADLGLSRADLEGLRAGTPGAQERIRAMAADFGVTPETLAANRHLSLHLAEICGHCSAAQTCQKVLKTGAALPHDECPNASIYEALKGI